MAKEKETKKNENVVVNEENVVDQLKSGNILKNSAVDAAIAELEKQDDENQKREAMHAIKEAQYFNLKNVIDCRKQKHQLRAQEETRNASKTLLDEFLAGKMTPTEYRTKKKELIKEQDKKYETAQKEHNEQIKELRTKFPDYWSLEWDSRY